MEVNARFIKFEKELMEKLLEGQDSKVDILRRQYETASVITREFSGVGFFTSFSVLEDSEKLHQAESLQLGGVKGQINGVANGVGFVLFINKGVIDLLEGYTYGDEKWPEILTEYTLARLQA